ncbi:unnamed protein product, partial [Arabidopsis halleri]
MQYLEAIRKLRSSGFEPLRPVYVTFVPGGFDGVAKLVESQILKKLNIAIVLEQAMENLTKSIESIMRFRASQFDLLKAGLKAEGDVISVNMVFLKAGTPTHDHAVAGFDIRVPPTADLGALERRLVEE